LEIRIYIDLFCVNEGLEQKWLTSRNLLQGRWNWIGDNNGFLCFACHDTSWQVLFIILIEDRRLCRK